MHRRLLLSTICLAQPMLIYSSRLVRCARSMVLTSLVVIKDEVLGHLKEWIDDMGSLRKNIADQAVDHIHANEVIMTFGASVTVAEFLIAAVRLRTASFTLMRVLGSKEAQVPGHCCRDSAFLPGPPDLS